jgi:hypothetical protein
MKFRIFIIAAFCFVTGFTNTGYSQADSLFSVNRKDSSGIYVVSYSGIEEGKVTVTVADHKGNTLATRSVKNAKNFSLPVNFTGVAEGVYTIQVDGGSDNQVKTINYNNSKAPTYSHVIDLGNDRYLLTASHAGTEKISIRIYDGNGMIVFDQPKVIRDNFSILFNLKNVSGKPSFEVTENSGRSRMIVL